MNAWWRRATNTACVLLLAPHCLAGRFGAPVDPDYDQTVTPAISYGVIGGRSSEFAGVTVNYGQALSQRWSWNAALAWDNEKSRKHRDDGKVEEKRVNTFTAIATAGYLLTQRLDLSFGFGKGFAEDDNELGPDRAAFVSQTLRQIGLYVRCFVACTCCKCSDISSHHFMYCPCDPRTPTVGTE